MSLSDHIPIPLDPIEWLRANPQVFFKSGRFEEDTAIGLLIREAVSSEGVTSTWTSRLDHWIAIGADADWLDGNAEAFAKPTHFIEGGQNATRVEVVLTAFCDAVSPPAEVIATTCEHWEGPRCPHVWLSTLPMLRYLVSSCFDLQPIAIPITSAKHRG